MSEGSNLQSSEIRERAFDATKCGKDESEENTRHKVRAHPSHLRDHVLDYGIPVTEKRQPIRLDLLLTPPDELHLIYQRKHESWKGRGTGLGRRYLAIQSILNHAPLSRYKTRRPFKSKMRINTTLYSRGRKVFFCLKLWPKSLVGEVKTSNRPIAPSRQERGKRESSPAMKIIPAWPCVLCRPPPS